MADVRGFSILELVVTLGLAATLAGVGVLSHNALRPRLNLGMAVRQLVMDLQVIRMRAVAGNANQRIVFSNGSTSYQLQRQTGTAYDDYGRPIALPPGITVLDCTARDSTISFRPRGNASSFGTVTLANMAGDVRRVVVDIAGRARVQ